MNKATPPGAGSAMQTTRVPGRHALARHCLMALLATVPICATTALHAQSRAARPDIVFDIPAGPLGLAINRLAVQSRLQITYAPELVAGLTTRGLSGRLEPQEALRRLLQDSGLGWDAVSDTVYVLKPVRGNSPSRESGPSADPAAAVEQPQPADPKTLEAIVVVGSRIGNAQPTAPVITLTREDIEQSGAITAADALKLVPQNFSRVNSSSAGITGGNVGFTTQADIRGLGPQATLTLVNGRRVSAAAGGEGRAVDVGLIPSGAIERIEVLTDSASALYGSDAIGGVVNFVLRDRYEGAEASVRYDANRPGASAESATGVFGTNWSGGSLLAGIQYQARRPLRYDRVGITSSDFTPFGGGDFRTSLAGNPGNVLPLGFQSGQPFTTFTDAEGRPVFQAAIPAGQDGSNLSLSDLRLNDANLGSFIADDLTPADRQLGGYFNLRQAFGGVDLFVDAIYNRRRMEVGANSADLLYVPASNAFSPFAEDVFVGYVFDDDRFFRYSVLNKGGAVNIGAEGAVGRGWSWRVFGTYSRDWSATSVTLPDPSALAVALASPDPEQAFNPFGDRSPQRPGVLQSILTRTVSYGRSGLRSFNAELRGGLAELPAGKLEMALAAEQREESLASGVRWAAGIPAREQIDSERRVSALAAELLVPVLGGRRTGAMELDLSLAARWERYSDFGSTTNPRIGMRWKLTDAFFLKASFGTAFRAPSLQQLFQAVSVQPAVQVADPNAPGGPAIVFTELEQGGNPHLTEERAKTYSATAEFRPQRVPGLNLGLTWYRIDYRDRIRGALDGLDLTTFLTFESALPPGLVQRDASGHLQRITLTDINSASTLVEGIDLSASYGLALGSGDLQMSGAATAFTRYRDRLIEGAAPREASGRVGTPADWRARLGLVWSSGEWMAATFFNHVDGLYNAGADPRIVRRRVDAQSTVDLQVGYDFPHRERSLLSGVSLRLGALNVFDEPAPFVDGREFSGIDTQNFRADGRTLYLQIKKPFGQSDVYR